MCIFHGLIAERTKTVEGRRVAHREPPDVDADRRAFTLPEVGDVEFHLAAAAGWNVVVDGVGEAVGLPAAVVAADEVPANPVADRRAVGERIVDILADGEPLVLGDEAFGLRPVARDRPVGRARAPEVGEPRLERVGDLVARAVASLRDAVLEAGPRVGREAGRLGPFIAIGDGADRAGRHGILQLKHRPDFLELLGSDRRNQCRRGQPWRGRRRGCRRRSWGSRRRGLAPTSNGKC